MKLLKINIYKANHIIETMLSAMSVYQRDYSKSMFGKIIIPKPLKSGETKYKFSNNALGFSDGLILVLKIFMIISRTERYI